MVSLQKESELENLPWQFRFEKLYRKLHGLPDNDPLLTGHCQTFIKAFEQILHEEISNREKEIAEEVKKLGNDCQMNTCGCGNSHCEKLYKKILSIIKHSSQ